MVQDSPDEIHLQVFRLLQERPDLTQRELAECLGVSLGKTNYVLKALIKRGLIKAQNFKNNQNKAAYAYIMTPRGIEEKAHITVRFLKRKLNEYEIIKQEIKELQTEIKQVDMQQFSKQSG